MSAFSYVAGSAALNAAQQGLLNYVGTWQVLSLSRARLDPLSLSNLPETMQLGVRQGRIDPQGTETYAASGFLQRAATYERTLLLSLGVEAGAAETFVGLGVPYGDYFKEPVYPWQEDARYAERILSEMNRLHDALGQARTRLDHWKRARTSFKAVREHVSTDGSVVKPLIALQEILVQNVARARWSLENFGATEEGLLAFFQIPTSRKSGTFPKAFDERTHVRAYETIAPPPAA